jgi:hypothetical protein
VTEGAGIRDIRDGDLPDDLTAAEAGMWQAFRNGTVYDLSSGDTVVDDPHGGHPWGPERTVRARIVCWLLLDGPPALAGNSPVCRSAAPWTSRAARWCRTWR